MTRCFEIETPLGKLKVWAKHEKDTAEDFPGVYIDLVRDDENILLACIEYDSCGEELQTCVYGDVLDDSPTDIVKHYNLEKKEGFIHNLKEEN